MDACLLRAFRRPSALTPTLFLSCPLSLWERARVRAPDLSTEAGMPLLGNVPVPYSNSREIASTNLMGISQLPTL
jgi:hypothetical protein